MARQQRHRLTDEAFARDFAHVAIDESDQQPLAVPPSAPPAPAPLPAAPARASTASFAPDHVSRAVAAESFAAANPAIAAPAAGHGGGYTLNNEGYTLNDEGGSQPMKGGTQTPPSLAHPPPSKLGTSFTECSPRRIRPSPCQRVGTEGGTPSTRKGGSQLAKGETQTPPPLTHQPQQAPRNWAPIPPSRRNLAAANLAIVAPVDGQGEGEGCH